jgi:hypothetical protein
MCNVFEGFVRHFSTFAVGRARNILSKAGNYGDPNLRFDRHSTVQPTSTSLRIVPLVNGCWLLVGT